MSWLSHSKKILLLVEQEFDILSSCLVIDG